MGDDELSADDAWLALRHYGGWRLLHDALLRFRYGDGFSHSRALGLQLCLAIVPFLIALTGLASDLGLRGAGRVLADVVLALTPGSSQDVVRGLLTSGDDRDADDVAQVLGLITGMVALVTAMAQIERGANRIYGVERDRPALAKYARATVLSVVAGVPALAGFLLLAAGGAVGDSIERWYHWGDVAHTIWNWVRWPLSMSLTVLSVGLLFRHSPRRRQPGLTWLLFGAGLSTVIWWLVSGLLAFYVRGSDAFDAYGALAGIMALLLWANLSGIAFFLGLAFAAQLEGARVGAPDPVEDDVWHPLRDPAPDPAPAPAPAPTVTSPPADGKPDEPPP
jgi:YihY family inner membrane protein